MPGLIHFYATCGCLDLAEKVFDNMLERSMVSWNVMIDAFIQSGEFVLMQNLFKPDGYTLQSIINACADLGALSLGMWVIAYILRKSDPGLVSSVFMSIPEIIFEAQASCKTGLEFIYYIQCLEEH